MTRLTKTVRQNIHMHLFGGATEHVSKEGLSRYACNDEDKVSGILEVCRKTRTEAMPIFYTDILLDIGQ